MTAFNDVRPGVVDGLRGTAVPSLTVMAAPDSQAPTQRFTSRQREIVLLIAAGCSNVEIGARLGISARTAKAHSDVVRFKLGVDHRRQIPLAYQLATGERLFGTDLLGAHTLADGAGASEPSPA